MGEASHLVLVGMMGSGKSTVGRIVAERLGRPFFDSDRQVEAHAGRTVREIFETDGEDAFRKIESEVLAEALDTPEPVVVSAAGGVVGSADNRARLRAAGRVIWLRADPSVLASRVRKGDHRPLLGDDPLAVLTRLAAERDALYRGVADEVIDVDTLALDEVVDRIVDQMIGEVA